MAGLSAQWQHRCVIEMVPGLSALFHLDKPEDDTAAADRSEDGSFQDWLKNVHLSMSTDGQLLAIANASQTVFMTASINTDEEGLKKYQLAWQGSLEGTDGDAITAILSLTISPQQSATTWHVVLVGFTSGHLRAYLPGGELLLSQRLHCDEVHAIHCQAGGVRVKSAITHGEELLLVYGNVIVALDGVSLLDCLRACMNRGRDSDQVPPLSYKKYCFKDTGLVTDIASIGVQTRTPLSTLREASFRETSVSHVHSEMVTSYIASSSSPPFVVYDAAEKMIRPSLSLVASVVAERLRTAVASQLSWAGSWLGVANSSESMAGRDPSTPVPPWRSMHDSGRHGRSVVLSPCGRWVATTDSLGRVLQMDTASMLVFRVWKGYRDAQCGWIAEQEEVASEDDGYAEGGRSAIFLLIYAPRRGIVELWPSDGGSRIGAYNVGKQCCLLYNPLSVLGQSRRSTLYPVLYHCALLHPSGNIWSLRVPFTAALSRDQQQALADQEAVDEIAAAAEDSPLATDELQRLLLSISSPLLARQALHLAVMQDYPPEVLLENYQALLAKWQGEDDSDVLQSYEHNIRLLKLYTTCNNGDSSMQGVAETSLDVVLAKLDVVCNLPQHNLRTLSEIVEVCNDLVVSVSDRTPVEHAVPVSGGQFVQSFRPRFGGGAGGMLELQSKVSSAQMDSIGLALCQAALCGDMETNVLISICQEAYIPVATITTLVLHAFIAMPVFSTAGVLLLNLREVLEILNEVSADDMWPAAHSVLLQARRPGAAWLAAVALEHLQVARKAAAKQDGAAHDQPGEWQNIVMACEEWTLMQLRLRDLAFFSSVTKIGMSVDSMIAADSTLITLHTARWVVMNKLTPDQLVKKGPGDAEAAASLAKSDEDKDKATTEDSVTAAQETVLTVASLQAVFPAALEHDLLMTECCHSAALHWSDNPECTEWLHLSMRYCLAIESVSIHQALPVLIWESFIVKYVQLLLAVLNKVGLTLKDSLCQQHVGLTWKSSQKMLDIALDFLRCLDSYLTMEDEDTLPEFVSDTNWNVSSRWNSWPGAYVISRLRYQNKASRPLLRLQRDVVALMHVRMWLQGKFKPSSLFSSLARDCMTWRITDEAGDDLELTVNRDLEVAREKALCQLCPSAARDRNGVTRILLLLEMMSLHGDIVRRRLIVEMFKVADEESERLALEMMWTIVEKNDLGVALLDLAVERMRDHFHAQFSDKQQIEFVSRISPNIASVLGVKLTRPKERKATPESRSALAFTKRLLVTVSGLLLDGQQMHTATMILEALDCRYF